MKTAEEIATLALEEDNPNSKEVQIQELSDQITKYTRQNLKQANEFIIDIAKLLSMDTDGIGYDELQFSIDDFQDAKELLIYRYHMGIKNEEPHIINKSIKKFLT